MQHAKLVSRAGCIPNLFSVLKMSFLHCFQNGVFFAQVLAVPLVMFSGVFLRFSAMHPCLRWISDVCYVRYGFEGMVLAVYGFDREIMPCLSQAYCQDRNPHAILENLEMENGNFWFDMGILVAHFFILRVLAFVFLKNRVSYRR